MAISAQTNSRLSQIQRYWELLYVLAEREIKVRYRGSFLGVYWSLFNPLIMTSLYTAIFGAAFSKYYHNSVVQYVLAAFTGLVVIHFFQGSTSQALGSVVGNGSLLNKIRLPVSVFPLSTILANTCQLVIGMLPLLSILTILISTRHRLSLANILMSLVNVLAIPMPLIALILVSTGIGLLISALYVFFRDLPFFYELVQFVMMLSSPIFYPAAIVDPKIRPILELNPLYPIIESLRQIVISGDLPDPYLIIRSWLSGLIILGIGLFIFNWLRPKFMDLL